MAERVNPKNRLPSHERIQFQEDLLGLQARLLIGGDAFNPNKLDLPPVSLSLLGKLEIRDYSPFNSASIRERKQYWQGKENDQLDRQKQKWTGDLVTLFQTNRDFFSKDARGKNWSALYSRIGINALDFNQQGADALYSRYFSGGKKDSNIKTFVSDIVSAYSNTDGRIDHEGLKRDLEGIQWLANIFGNVSSEVIAQLVDAEIKLQTQPQLFVSEVNNKQHDKLRINDLLPKEKQLLSFLSGITPIEQPRTVTAEWKYERLGDPRKFPKEFSYVEQAKQLKHKYPQKYAQVPDAELAEQMQMEANALNEELTAYGLSRRELHNLTLGFIEKEVLSHYRQFIKSRYGINLPRIDKLGVIPIDGMMSELHTRGRALAFVEGLSPYMFLDMDAIATDSQRLTHKDWQDLSKRERGELMKRLIREIEPHEFTHLVSDIAHWDLVSLSPGKSGEVLVSDIGKLGLLLGKPKINHSSLEFLERGRGLMEAVTVELTKQWAISMNSVIDLPVYAGERQILYELQNLLLREDNIHNEQSFRQFVDGYFTPKGYLKLVQMVDGHKKGPDGKFMTKRPHFLSIVYGLMQYEVEKHAGASSAYPLTYLFLQKKLSGQQKQEILTNIDQLQLAPEIKVQLRRDVV